MTKPLALLLYRELFPGSQLTNRLHDLGYRVETVEAGGDLVAKTLEHKPILAVMELLSDSVDVCAMIRELRENSDTGHLPVLAYAKSSDEALQKAGREAGATLIASSEGLLDQLPALLEHVLEVD